MSVTQRLAENNKRKQKKKDVVCGKRSKWDNAIEAPLSYSLFGLIRQEG